MMKKYNSEEVLYVDLNRDRLEQLYEKDNKEAE